MPSLRRILRNSLDGKKSHVYFFCSVSQMPSAHILYIVTQLLIKLSQEHSEPYVIMPAYLRGSYMSAYRQFRSSKRYTRAPKGPLTGPRMRVFRMRAPVTLFFFFSIGSLDNDFAASNPRSTNFTAISAGDATNQRDGRVIFVTNVRGQIVTPSGDNICMIIYISKIAGDIIVLSALQDAVDPNSFTVLYDNYWHSSNNGGNRQQKFNVNLGRNGKRIEFNGTFSNDNVTPEIKMYIEAGTGTGLCTGNYVTTFYDL